MSASNAAAEPSMEEILSSIRQAINEDIPGAVPENVGDPFASGSSAEAAFSAPPPGQAFDAAVHESHDPFAELTRKLNETRESVQKQMHGVSANLKPEDADEAPAAAQAAPPPPLVEEEQLAPDPQMPPTSVPINEEPEPIRAETYSATLSETSKAEPTDEPVGSGALQALTARVAEEQNAKVEPPNPTPTTDIAQSSLAQQPSESQSPAPDADRYTKPQMPELSWASAERTATTQTAANEKPQPAAPETPAAATSEPAPAAEPKVEIDPFPKLTAIVERGAAENTSSAKTDHAMVDLVLRRILEPAVKSWLDDNLPKIVTEVVREEVRRVANQSN